MKQNKSTTSIIKKIKICPKPSLNKTPTKKIATGPKAIVTSNIIDSITKMMSDCSLASDSILTEQHYAIVPIFLDINNIMINYRKNITEGGLHNLYLLVTKIFVNNIRPYPTINIFPGEGPEIYPIEGDIIKDIEKVKINEYFTLHLLYLKEFIPQVETHKGSWLRYIEFYNHYIESYQYIDDGEIRSSQVISHIEQNPYRAIMENSFGRKGHIRDIKIKTVLNGEEIEEFPIKCIYDNLVKKCDELNLNQMIEQNIYENVSC